MVSGQLEPMEWCYLLWCVTSHLVTDIPVSIVVPDCFMKQSSCRDESAIKKSRWLWRMTASPDEAPDVTVDEAAMTESVMLSSGMCSSQPTVDSRWCGIRLEGLEPIDTDGDSRSDEATTAVHTPRWTNLI